MTRWRRSTVALTEGLIMAWFVWLMVGVLLGVAAGVLIGSILCAAGYDAPRRKLN